MKAKTLLRRTLLPLMTALLTCSAWGQSGPAYVIADTSINISSDIWVVDPDSLRGNYPWGFTTMVIHAPAGTRLNLQVDYSNLRDDWDHISLYDGPTTAAPLLSTITRSNGDWGVQTSGPVATLYFRAAGGDSNAPWGWRLKVSPFREVEKTADFTPVYQGFHKGNIKLNDYDRDGDEDVLMGGVVYRNDSRDDSLFVFDRLPNALGAWKSNNMAAADFDGDGLKEVFIVGEEHLPGQAVRKAAIYKWSNGAFTAVPGTTFQAGFAGAVSTPDFNGDGRPDIAYSGWLAGVYFFKLYINQGNFQFTEKQTGLPGLLEGSMSWCDYDEDGDLDLLYNGNSGTTIPPHGLFINENNTTFTKSDIVVFPVQSGKIEWVDVDKDGRYDIVNTGLQPNYLVAPEIYFNKGNNLFTRVKTNIAARYSPQWDWADYDGDGDMDMVMTGTLSTPTDNQQDAAVYKNGGEGQFTKIPLRGIPPFPDNIQSLSNAQWLDFNGDGRLDIFVPARGIHPSLLYKNMGADSFQVSSYPFAAYELKGTALAEDFTGDGVVDFLFAGELNDQNCEEGVASLLVKGVGWKVFPTAVLTQVADLAQGQPWANDNANYWRWGDVDSDGLDDILLTNDPGRYTTWPVRVFKNKGDHTFSLLQLSGEIYHTQVGVVDMENDGINELYAVPNKLYRWNGNGFTAIHDDAGYCSIDGCNGLFYDFADFNGDGLTDVAYTSGNMLHLLRNNGQGRFVDIKDGWALGYNERMLEWADFDNDGDPDLLTTENAIWENTEWGGFRYRDGGIARHGHTGIADFNGDGWLDVFSLPYRTVFGPTQLYYNHQGTFAFSEKTPPGFIQIFNSVYNEGAEAFDVDRDGDMDLIYSTASLCSYSGLYLNNANLRGANLALRTPNGRETYFIGRTLPVRWVGDSIGPTVRIELSVDGGATWSTIAPQAPSAPNGGQYDWPIAGVSPSARCLVRITDNTTNTLVDKSSLVFTLAANVATAVGDVTVVRYSKVYPNPVQGSLQIELPSSLRGRKALVQVFSAQGGLVLARSFTVQGTNSLPLPPMARGIYIVKVTAGGLTEAHRVVKL